MIRWSREETEVGVVSLTGFSESYRSLIKQISFSLLKLLAFVIEATGRQNLATGIHPCHFSHFTPTCPMSSIPS